MCLNILQAVHINIFCLATELIANTKVSYLSVVKKTFCGNLMVNLHNTIFTVWNDKAVVAINSLLITVATPNKRKTKKGVEL